MLINTLTDFQRVMDWLPQQDRIAYDTETTGLDPYKEDRICGVALYNRGQHFYLPFRHGLGVNLPLSKLQPLLQGLVESRAKIITWNGKFDLHMSYIDGMPLMPTGKMRDAMLAAHLCDENEDNYKLKPLSDKYLGDVSSKDEQELKGLIESRFRSDIAKIKGRMSANAAKLGDVWKSLMWKLYPEEVADYAESDVRLTMGMEDFYAPHLEAWGLTEMYGEVCDYLLLITRMEKRGCKLDLDFIHQEIREAGPRMLEAQEEIGLWAKDPNINPNSPQQLARSFGWYTIKNGKQATNTNKEFLEGLSEDFGEDTKDGAVSRAILAYRDYSKQQSSYYQRYLEMVDPTQTLRPSYNIIGTYTGRLSCYNPNLQAVPRSSETNRVKSAFIARDGFVMAEGDYNQAELRVFSHYAQEHTLGEALMRREDLHTRTATRLGIPRWMAKRINFSVVYGVGAAKLAINLGVPYEEAAKALKDYHAEYTGFKRLYRQMDNVAQKYGYIRLDSGRVRRYNRGHEVTPTHKASSNLIQGTVAEVMRVAMQRIDRELGGTDEFHLLLQVHDSLLFEIEEGKENRYIPEVQRIMCEFPFTYPMEVDFKVGNRWGTLGSWKPEEAEALV